MDIYVQEVGCRESNDSIAAHSPKKARRTGKVMAPLAPYTGGRLHNVASHYSQIFVLLPSQT